jgi:hypothetical protein
MTCKWNGREYPRTISGRHVEDCHVEDCPGCQPCDSAHCRVCGVAHADGSCPECLAETRETLRKIPRRYLELHGEAETKGIDSEAEMLNGPTANPEAWLQRGRFGHKYHADARLGDNHPAWVLGSWQYRYQAELGHETPIAFTIPDAADYLDRNLAYFGGYADLVFEDLATDLRTCLRHMEAVLHDQAFGDRANVACFDCGGNLERKLTDEGFEDHWTCGLCRRRYTYAEYNFALRAKLEESPA